LSLFSPKEKIGRPKTECGEEPGVESRAGHTPRNPPNHWRRNKSVVVEEDETARFGAKITVGDFRLETFNFKKNWDP
jgi:hypothetical protein